MRTDNAGFTGKNALLNKEPLYYVEVMYDNAYTDPYYFTSDSAVDLPADATTANTFHGSLKIQSGTQQKINPIKAVSSIGGSTVEIVDVAGVLSNLISTKWAAEESLTNKRFRFYVGYRGLTNSQYVNVTTQIKSDHEYTGTSYIFKLEDLQRTTKKNIFELNETTLSQSVTVDQIAIPVSSTSAFELNWHDANYSHLPSQSAGYISIKVQDTKEVISYLDKVSTAVTVAGTDISFASGDSSLNSVSTDLSVFTAGQFLNVDGSASNDRNFIIDTVATHKLTLVDLNGDAVTVVTESAGASITAGAPVQFYNCTRGVLNTRPQLYTVDTTITADRRQKVSEHVYLETTVPKLIYGILTGIWLGTANTLPSNWNLAIDTSLINSASFSNINDTRIFRFSGEKKQDAKQFIAEQLCLPLALYTRVLNDGTIALRRATGVLSDASCVRVITSADIVSYTNLNYRDKELINRFSVAWNYEDERETTTRLHILEDTASVAKFGAGESTLALTFRGLHGSATTLQDIYNVFNMMRDRHAGPPIRWSIRTLYKHNDLEIGDIIRVQLPEVYDATNRVVTYVDRSFEIQGIDVDWLTGDVNLELFGSTEKAGELSSTDAATVLSNTFYTQGTALNSVITMSGNTIAVNGSLTGGDTPAEFYHGADLTLNAGITLSFTKNVFLYVKGFVTINGTITGAAAGDTDGDGAMGSTLSGGANQWAGNGPGSRFYQTILPGTLREGTSSSIPYFDIKPDANGDTITGMPTDLQGMAGATGPTTVVSGGLSYTGTLTGGAGANGGGGLVIVCRGIAAGANGKIITSGGDGTDGSVATIEGFVLTKSGPGAGGAPGGVLILIDGNDYSSTLIDSNFEQYLGNSPEIGVYPRNVGHTIGYKTKPLDGFTTRNQNTSFWRVQYIPDTTAAVEDVPGPADKPTTLAPTETTNSPSTVAQNLSTVQIDVTPPSDTNYSYSNIYYKLSTQDEYVYVGPALNSVTLPPTAMDGSTYDVIARAVSKTGVESTDYTHTTVTVSNAKGGANMATGNYIAVGQTAFDTGQGAWIEKTASGVKASFGNSAGDKIVIDNDAGSIVTIVGDVTATSGTIGGWTIGTTDLTSGSGANTVGLDSGGSNPAIYCGSATPGSAPFRVTQAGAVTATNATVTGTITTSALTADGGTIGGWDLSSTTIESTNNRVILDSSNQRVQVQNAAGTSYVRLDANGVTGVDSVLGTVFTLPTDGSAPTFASGVINSTIYNISTSGILRTASTVGDGSAASAGVIINDTGIKGFPSNSSTPNFHLSTTDGGITSIKGTIGGWTIGSTSLVSGSGATTVGLDSGGTNPAIYCGSATPASAPFRVTQAGAVTATSGTIGGWTLSGTAIANGTNMVIDSSNMYIGIKSSTFGAPGIQLQYNSGTPRFYVGNGGYKSVQFDGTDVILGRDSKLLGADAYNNDNIYISGFLPWFFYQDNSTGGGSFGTSADGIVASVASAGSAWGQWLRNVGDSFTSFTWDNDRRVKYKVYTPASTANQAVIGTGARNASYTEFLGFVFETDGYIYSRSAGGSSNTDTSLQTWSTSTYYEIEVVYDPNAAEAYFYVNGTLKATHYANLPSGTSNANVWTTILMTWTSGSSSIGVQEVKFEQQ